MSQDVLKQLRRLSPPGYETVPEMEATFPPAPRDVELHSVRKLKRRRIGLYCALVVVSAALAYSLFLAYQQTQSRFFVLLFLGGLLPIFLSAIIETKRRYASYISSCRHAHKILGRGVLSRARIRALTMFNGREYENYHLARPTPWRRFRSVRVDFSFMKEGREISASNLLTYATCEKLQPHDEICVLYDPIDPRWSMLVPISPKEFIRVFQDFKIAD